MNSGDLIAKLRSRKGEAITRVERLMDEAASHIEAQSKALEEMREALLNALAWIDAVPDDVALPAMPGFDRDDVDEILASHSKEGEQ